MKKAKIIPFALCAFSVVGMTGCGKKVVEDPVEPAEPTHVHSYELKHDGTNHWQECSCGDKKDLASHAWTETSKQDATCQHGEITIFQCNVCNEVRQEEGLTKVDHHYHLDYIVPATCVSDGKYVYICDNCTDTKEMKYSDPDAHLYGRLDYEGNFITYNCINEGCEASYRVFSAKEKEVAEVSMSDLAEAGAIELKEATIALDEDTLLGLGKEVTIGAEKLSEEELSQKVTLTEETKEILKDSQVFDFSMKSGEEEVHDFLGKVTVSIPYELKAGEDPNGISIAYISDSGEIENIPATYRNNLVSFETSHFSVYALVKMTAEEACAKFGHSYSLLTVNESTCSKHGSEVYICTRCNHSSVKELALADHKYSINGVHESSKYEHGYIEYKCSECGDSFTEELPLLPENDNGYVMNFITSLLSQNLKFTVKVEEEGKVDTEIAALALAEDDKFILTYSDGEISSLIDGEKSYYYGRVNDNNTLNIVVTIAQLIKSSPQSVVKLLEIVTDVLTNTLVTKLDTPAGATITFDKAKVKALIEAVKTEDVVAVADRIFGAGFYDKLYDLVANFSTRTIQESFDKLEESFGINSKELYDFVIEILPILFPHDAKEHESPVEPLEEEKPSRGVGDEKEEHVPTYEEFFTKEMLESKGTSLISMLPEEIGSIIGSKEAIDSFVNRLTSVSVVDLISNLSGEDIGKILEQFDDAINSMLDSIKFEINTTTSGQVLNGSCTVSGFELFGAPEGAKISLGFEPITNMEELIAECDKYKTECQEAVDAFDFTKQEVIDKTIGRMYNGLKFTYYQSYRDLGPCFVSEETNMFNTIMDYESDTLTRLVLAVPNSSYISRYDDVHNMYNGHKVVQFEASFFSAYLEINNDDFSNLIDVYFYDIFPSGSWTSWIYDLETKTYTPSKTYYEANHLYKFEQVTKAEYEAHGGYASPYADKFFKKTCLICGHVQYTTDSSRAVEGYLLSPLMNEEARKYSFHIDCYSGSERSPVNIDVLKLDDIDFTKGNYAVSLDEVCEGKNKVFTYGNVTFIYEFKERTGYPCQTVNTVTILIDGKVFTKIVKNMHDSDEIYSIEKTTQLSECLEETRIYYYCKDCDALVSESYYTEGTHKYESTIYIPGNEIFYSVCKFECSKCHDSYFGFSVDEPHYLVYNRETMKYYCAQCDEEMEFVEHFHFADLANALPEGLEARNLPNNYGAIVVASSFMMDEEWGSKSGTIYDLFRYQVSFVVADTSSDEIVPAEDGIVNLTTSMIEEIVISYKTGGAYCPAIILSKEQVAKLEAALEANEDMSLYIMITDTRLTGNTFIIPFSFAD